jgi:hypothetical protein
VAAVWTFQPEVGKVLMVKIHNSKLSIKCGRFSSILID